MGRMRDLTFTFKEVKRTETYIRWEVDYSLIAVLTEFNYEVLNSIVPAARRISKSFITTDEKLRFTQDLQFNTSLLECLTHRYQANKLSGYLEAHNITFVFDSNTGYI